MSVFPITAIFALSPNPDRPAVALSRAVWGSAGGRLMTSLSFEPRRYIRTACVNLQPFSASPADPCRDQLRCDPLSAKRWRRPGVGEVHRIVSVLIIKMGDFAIAFQRKSVLLCSMLNHFFLPFA